MPSYTTCDDQSLQKTYLLCSRWQGSRFTVLLPKRRPQQLAARPNYASQYLLFWWMWHRAACSVAPAADGCALGKIILRLLFKVIFCPFKSLSKLVHRGSSSISIKEPGTIIVATYFILFSWKEELGGPFSSWVIVTWSDLGWDQRATIAYLCVMHFMHQLSKRIESNCTDKKVHLKSKSWIIWIIYGWDLTLLT